MKNQYFGDINDYKKYGLLRCIGDATDLTIAVAWMLTPDDKSTDGKFTNYLSAPQKWRQHDPELFDSLASTLSDGTKRHVGLAQKTNLIPSARYFDRTVPDSASQRNSWFEKLVNFVEPSDLVFLDPDNGFEVKSRPYGKPKSSKYLYWRELEALWGKGKSILVYQHFIREKRPVFIQRMLTALHERTPGSLVSAFSTANVVFLMALQPKHQKQYKAIEQSISKRWSDKVKHWQLEICSIEVPAGKDEESQSKNPEGLSDELISQFRNKVNEHNFVYHYYSNKDGKNYWNPICSCMDWISVAVRSIIYAEPLSQNIDVRSMQIYSLISSIDLVSEAIISLHTIFNKTKRRISPFKGDCSIFEQQDGLDDDDYFKHIRACFGAHPVNLNLNGGTKRYFASWPHEPSIDKGDLKVLLYSNEVGQPDGSIILNKRELIKYLDKRYHFLADLIDTIEMQKKQFANQLAKQAIDVADDPLSQLHILERESARRTNNDHINQLISELKYIFSASIPDAKHKAVEDSFKQELRPLISELYDVLQRCQFDFELLNDSLVNMNTLYGRFEYEMPKLSSFLYSGKPDSLVDYYFERLKEADKWGFDLSQLDPTALTILKLHLLNRLMMSEKSEIPGP